MTDKEKIRAEIERRYKEYMEKDSELAAIRADECLDILSIIDSMQEEPISDKLGGINNALIQDKCVQEHLVCNDLEDEITRYCEPIVNMLCNALNNNQKYSLDFGDIARHFADWQKQQMMKDAVKGGCFSYRNGYKHISCDIEENHTDIKLGDRVKMIIIKEE